ncbi:transposase family protein [Streptomyces sp. NPDC087844]|uniref:transposase family protein n=1 Tax=Streptomyces sp. NPDC087844 TaxID=3365805 RepID=UPI00382E7CA9
MKGSATTRPRDLPYGERELEFLWHKRRWFCREPPCPRKSFTEQIPQIPAGARLTGRLRSAAGRRIRAGGFGQRCGGCRRLRGVRGGSPWRSR